MAKRLDEREEADKAMYKVLNDPDVEKKIEERRAKEKSMMEMIKENRRFFLETMLIRHVDNYLNYLSSLLYEIFTQKSQTLKSSERIEIETVLNCDTISDVVRIFAERKVESLSFSSIKDLYDFFMDRFKIELFREDLISVVVEGIETRNISVHNRCIINRRYLSKTHCGPELIGTKKDMIMSKMDEFVGVCLESVKAVDQMAQSKLGITAQPLKLDDVGLLRSSDSEHR